MDIKLTQEEIEALMKCVMMACSEGLYLFVDGKYPALTSAVEKLGHDLGTIEEKCM